MTRFARRSIPFNEDHKSGREVLYQGSFIHRIMNNKIWFYIMVFLLGFLFLMMLAPAGAFRDFHFSLQYFLQVLSRILGQ
jgi:hypothetical protein